MPRRWICLLHGSSRVTSNIEQCKSTPRAQVLTAISSPFPLISSDWPLPKLQEYFKDDTLALIGYGSQGHGQGLNARDNGLNVIVGVREGGESWKQAQEDGWVRVLISLLFCSSYSFRNARRSRARTSSRSTRPSRRVPSS